MLRENFIQLCVSSYSLANRSGILKTRFGKAIFYRLYFLYKKYAEDALALFLQRYSLQIPEGYFIDVGANIGYTAQVLSQFQKKNYRVYAFEPDSTNFESLLNIAAEGENISAHRIAIGSENGSVKLWINLNHHADHRIATEEFSKRIQTSELVSVPLRSIDSLVEEFQISPIALIKIDVQGYELEVLKGMSQELSQNKSLFILFEFAPEQLYELGTRNIYECFDFLASFGMQFFLLQRNGTLTPLTEFQETLSSESYYDVLAVGSKVQLCV